MPDLLGRYSDFLNKNMNPKHKEAKMACNSKIVAPKRIFERANKIRGKEKGNLARLIKAVSNDVCLSIPRSV